jgi:hypothetical protein
MNRRHFLHRSLAATGGAAAFMSKAGARTLAAHGGRPDTAPSKIGYIRPEIPTFEIPAYRGKRYEDTVPATLDITERAKLGVHVLTSITDPAADYQIYWAANLFRNPPVMEHQFDDYHVQVVEGFLEALPLLRLATGSDLNSNVDQVWMANFQRCIGPDGLFYLPLVGGPWDRPTKPMGLVWRPDGSASNLADPSVTQISTGQICARCLGTMTVYYLRDHNPTWKQAGERMVQRLSALALNQGDYSYLPDGNFEPNGKVGKNPKMPAGLDAIELNGRLSQGLSQYYRATGYEPALNLAKRLVTYFRHHSGTFDEQGRFLWADSDRNSLGWGYSAKYETIGGHAHGRAIGLLSMLEYAAAAGDRDTMQFVKTSFEWAKGQEASPFGVSTLVGWFPEWYYPQYPSCEACMAADMTALALKLSAAGLGDYWDEVERWVRNNFAEQQLTSADWVYRMAERQPRRPVPPHSVAEHMPERNVGAFAGWSSGNDWVVNGGIMHCCTGNSTRTIYYIWQHSLQHAGDELRVNLLLNRASQWADVHSYIPYTGRVDLRIKAPLKSLTVRAPEWVKTGSGEIRAQVNGGPRALGWDGRYINLGPANAGDVAVLTFPIAERTVKERIGPETYTLAVKGTTVVAIEPSGQNGPLYADRSAYRSDDLLWRKVERFVADEPVAW